jgi:hypothetical protein
MVFLSEAVLQADLERERAPIADAIEGSLPSQSSIEPGTPL